MDALGFGRLCEEQLGQFVPSAARHRPEKLLGSLAAMLPAGGEHASDLDVLRSSPGVFGAVPSNATVSRSFERIVVSPELFSYGFETLTRQLRSRAWDAAGDRNWPCLRRPRLIIDLDATLVKIEARRSVGSNPWMTTIVDLDTGQVLGVVDGRDHKCAANGC
jgi:hypothetical protein